MMGAEMGVVTSGRVYLLNSSVKEHFYLKLMRLKLPFGTQTGQYKYI